VTNRLGAVGLTTQAIVAGRSEKWEPMRDRLPSKYSRDPAADLPNRLEAC
jgi:hypothetical protein